MTEQDKTRAYQERQALLKLIPETPEYSLIREGVKSGNEQVIKDFYNILDSLQKSGAQKETKGTKKTAIEAHREAHNITVDQICEKIKKMTKGGVYLGFKKMDETLKLLLGDFMLIEAMSSHGKTTFMLNTMINLIKSEKNKGNNPMVFYYPYESSAPKIYLKLLNTIAQENIVEFNSSMPNDATEQEPSPLGDYSITDKDKFKTTKETLQTYITDKSLVIPQGRYSLEDIESCIESYSNDKEFDGRTKIFMFDYIQIIKTAKASDAKMNWLDKDKVAEDLARIAEDNECIVIAGSQLTDKFEIAQAKSIYNAVSLSFRIFNHSHAKIKNNADAKLAERYIHRYEGKMTLSIDITKSRNFDSQEWDKQFYLKDGNTIGEYRQGELENILKEDQETKALEKGDALREVSGNDAQAWIDQNK